MAQVSPVLALLATGLAGASVVRQLRSPATQSDGSGLAMSTVAVLAFAPANMRSLRTGSGSKAKVSAGAGVAVAGLVGLMGAGYYLSRPYTPAAPGPAGEPGWFASRGDWRRFYRNQGLTSEQARAKAQTHQRGGVLSWF